MHKLKLYSYLMCCLLTKTVFADTAPAHFDIGDIAPRQKIKFNMDVQKWPGYHDIKCDIIDPSYSAIIRISSEDSTPEIIQINQTKYNYYFPLQISLTEQKNKLTFYKMYNPLNEESNNVTFENLDDDVTISVKNCEVSPNAILSRDLIYLPSTITCSKSTCKMQGGSPNVWNEFTAPDGIYTFQYTYQQNIVTGSYYSYQSGTSVSITSKNNVKPYIDIYTSWIGAQCQPSPPGAVIKCPLQKY